MRTKQAPAKDIDEYIAGFPADVQKILETVRTTIRKAVPTAGEKISYQIPTFTLNGTYLVYFAGFQNHVSVYPAPVESEELKEELAPYKAGKGTVRFPLDKPVPLDVITKIVKYLEKNNLERTQAKGKKKA